jgi:hypothetical protein
MIIKWFNNEVCKYEGLRLMINKSDYMITFDTTSFSRLLADSLKYNVKSMTYKCVVTEWE